MQLAEGRHQHLRNACEGASAGLLVAVERAADEEAANGQTHGHRRHAKAPTPTHVLLNVHQRRGRNQSADVDGEVEPVEEGRLPLLLLHVIRVELIRSAVSGAATRNQQTAYVVQGSPLSSLLKYFY